MMNADVVVTTDKRGVFFGRLVRHEGDVADLADAQNCIYWSTQTRGVLGLAAKGPQKGSRVGPPISLLTLNGVTSLAKCSKEASAAWKEQPWK